MRFKAEYFDGTSSRKHDVEVYYRTPYDIRIETEGGGTIHFTVEDIEIVPPLGSAPRIIRFKDGAQLRTTDAEAVESIEERLGRTGGQRLVHLIERNRWSILCMLAALVLFAAAFYVYAIPWLARDMAFRLPAEMRTRISEEAMTFMDRRFFRPSELDEETAARMHRLFDDIVAGASEQYEYRLEIRKSRIGPNAFALPGGIVLLTDELVELAEGDLQVAAVLAHEVGHVEHQHGMRMVIQSAGIVFMATVMFGDVTSLYALTGALPAMLAQNAYSRSFEIEADAYAARYLLAEGHGTEPLQEILLLIRSEETEIPLEKIISTHPTMRQRVDLLRAMDKGPEE